jgi:trimethylamine corrinoid protein
MRTPINAWSKKVNSIDSRVEALESALLAVDRTRAREIFMKGVQTDGSLPFMENLVGEVFDRIGAAWESGSIALSQVYMAGRICEELSLAVLPSGHPDRKNDPDIAVALFEDHHTLGKRMVLSVLRTEGYATLDWGQVNLESTLARLRREPVDILMLSCLMLSSALHIRKLTKAIREEHLPVKVVVGGAPFRFDTELWMEVGADAMGTTASLAGALVRSLNEGQS